MHLTVFGTVSAPWRLLSSPWDFPSWSCNLSIQSRTMIFFCYFYWTFQHLFSHRIFIISVIDSHTSLKLKAYKLLEKQLITHYLWHSNHHCHGPATRSCIFFLNISIFQELSFFRVCILILFISTKIWNYSPLVSVCQLHPDSSGIHIKSLISLPTWVFLHSLTCWLLSSLYLLEKAYCFALRFGASYLLPLGSQFIQLKSQKSLSTFLDSDE